MAAPPVPQGPRVPGYWGAVATLHGAVLLFGVAGLFGKWVAAPALTLVLGRVVAASAGLGLLLRLRPPPGPAPAGAERWRLWACGAVLAGHWAAFFHAIQVSTVAVGLLGYATAPVFAALLEPLWFRERFSRTALGCALLTVAGVALIVLPDAPGDAARGITVGMGWGVAAGFSFAVLSLLNRGLVRRHSAIRIAFHQDLAAAVLLAPLVAWRWSPLSAQDVALLAVLGLVCTALAHSLFIAALAVLTARTAAIAGALEPVYGIVLAWLLLGEVPAVRTVAGGALILAAVAWATVRPGGRA